MSYTDDFSGLHNLRRYFELVVFQAYLQSMEADTLQSVETFQKFIENRPGRATGHHLSYHVFINCEQSSRHSKKTSLLVV